jgi:hypothetical protein
MNTRVQEYDLDQPMSCRRTLMMLWGIYVDNLAGTRARVRFGTRWSEYHAGNSDLIRETYQAVYAQCDDVAGLPNLGKGYQMRRGRPGVVVNSGTFEGRRAHMRGPMTGII